MYIESTLDFIIGHTSLAAVCLPLQLYVFLICPFRDKMYMYVAFFISQYLGCIEVCQSMRTLQYNMRTQVTK